MTNDPYLVIIRLNSHDKFEHVNQMICWCIDNCESLWDHNYYSWEQHQFRFTSMEDHAKFTLTWYQ
jgi:hypothetical protein